MKTKTAVNNEYNNSLLSIFPNFHRSGSIYGMKKYYYGKDALLIKCGSYIYKVTEEIYNMF